MIIYPFVTSITGAIKDECENYLVDLLCDLSQDFANYIIINCNLLVENISRTELYKAKEELGMFFIPSISFTHKHKITILPKSEDAFKYFCETWEVEMCNAFPERSYYAESEEVENKMNEEIDEIIKQNSAADTDVDAMDGIFESVFNGSQPLSHLLNIPIVTEETSKKEKAIGERIKAVTIKYCKPCKWERFVVDKTEGFKDIIYVDLMPYSEVVKPENVKITGLGVKVNNNRIELHEVKPGQEWNHDFHVLNINLENNDLITQD